MLLWPPNRAAIMFCHCGFFFLFFLTCSYQSQIGCLPYFQTWCGLSVNLECTSVMCCTRLAENTGCKNSPCVQCTPSHNFVVYIFTAKACIDNWKKNLLNSNASSTCPPSMVNFCPLTADIVWQVWGTPANIRRAAITLGIGPHSGFCLMHVLLNVVDYWVEIFSIGTSMHVD